jgi:hypothetical protein
VHALLAWQIAAPIIGVALKHDALASAHLSDFVRTRTDRRPKRRLVEMLGVDMLLRQDRHDRQNERQLAVADGAQIIVDRVLIGRGHGLDERERGPLLWPALCFQKVEAEGNVS